MGCRNARKAVENSSGTRGRRRVRRASDRSGQAALPIADGVGPGHFESPPWKAAWIVQGRVDAADYKTYLFPLRFFKRISDVHNVEPAAAPHEFGGDEVTARFPDNHRFPVPEGCHWRHVRKASVNVGHASQTALRGIEQANPHTLHGIFRAAQWTNRDRLPDKHLRDLIEHFSALPRGHRAAEAAFAAWLESSSQLRRSLPALLPPQITR